MIITSCGSLPSFGVKRIENSTIDLVLNNTNVPQVAIDLSTLNSRSSASTSGSFNIPYQK